MATLERGNLRKRLAEVGAGMARGWQAMAGSLDIQTILRMSLERVGCEVVAAGNGLEALASIYGCSCEDMRTRVGRLGTLPVEPERRPDVVITDIWMPEEMDGYEFLACLQRSPALSDLPVIVLTGTAKRRTDIMQAYELGAIDYLTKPFKNEELVGTAPPS